MVSVAQTLRLIILNWPHMSPPASHIVAPTPHPLHLHLTTHLPLILKKQETALKAAFMIEISELQFSQGRLSLSLSLSLSFHLRHSPSAPRSAVAAPAPTRTERTHTNGKNMRTHLPLPAVSLFSANVAKCLHFCITAAIKPLSLLFLLFPALTSLSLALCYFLLPLSSRYSLSFCPPSFFRYETGLRVGKKKNLKLKFSLSSCFLLRIPCLPSFSSLSSPALPYFYHSTINSDPLLSSSFIPLFYMHPPPPLHFPSAPSCPLSVPLILFLSQPILLSALFLSFLSLL